MNAGIAAGFAHSCKPEPQPKWFPGRCHTAASAPESLSDTRSEGASPSAEHGLVAKSVGK